MTISFVRLLLWQIVLKSVLYMKNSFHGKQTLKVCAKYFMPSYIIKFKCQIFWQLFSNNEEAFSDFSEFFKMRTSDFFYIDTF